MNTIRTFLALPLPDSLRVYLIQMLVPIMDSRDKINWVKPDNIHITLNFLGDTDETALSEQAAAIARFVSNMEAFDLGTTDTGVFPHANDPRILWVGAAAFGQGLQLFKSELDIILRQFGYRVDYRKFQPHITLGRVKSISRKSSFIHDFLVTNVQERVFTIDEMKWLKSTLTPDGPVYEEIYNFKLNQGGHA